jgi:hypothetical protein
MVRVWVEQNRLRCLRLGPKKVRYFHPADVADFGLTLAVERLMKGGLKPGPKTYQQVPGKVPSEFDSVQPESMAS